MDIEVFDVFDLTDYMFLQISRGGVYGNQIVSQYDAAGVFKLKNGMVTTSNMESRQSNATLHVRPEESFVEAVNGQLVGHGIRCQGQTYEIIGQTGGQNYDNGKLEHYRLTLQVADFVGVGGS